MATRTLVRSRLSSRPAATVTASPPERRKQSWSVIVEARRVGRSEGRDPAGSDGDWTTKTEADARRTATVRVQSIIVRLVSGSSAAKATRSPRRFSWSSIIRSRPLSRSDPRRSFHMTLQSVGEVMGTSGGRKRRARPSGARFGDDLVATGPLDQGRRNLDVHAAPIRRDPPRPPICLSIVRSCSLLRITSSSENGATGCRIGAVGLSVPGFLDSARDTETGGGGVGVGTSRGPGVSDSAGAVVPVVGIGGIKGMLIGSIEGSVAVDSTLGTVVASVGGRSDVSGVTAASVIPADRVPTVSPTPRRAGAGSSVGSLEVRWAGLTFLRIEPNGPGVPRNPRSLQTWNSRGIPGTGYLAPATGL